MKEKILKCLREAEDYVSGQELCQMFDVSRTAIWKVMNQLKEEGYVIDAVKNKGYRLVQTPDLVTHDSVRPFVTHRMIEENIQAAMACGACDTVIPATDTIVESKDHQNISCIPERSTMYLGQTPQSFKAKKLRDIYLNMTEEEKEILTDACKIMVLKGEQVRLVEGDVTNIKITYPSDIRMAESLLGGK